MANGFDTAEESYVGDDPTGIGYDEAGTSVASGVGYGSPNIDTGGNETTGEVLSQAGFNQARGITATNPYPDSFFSRLFGPENVNYAALGIDTQGIANLAYDRYLNPFGNITRGTKFEDLNLREGMSEGEKTRYGEVISVDRPQGIGETIARTAFGLGTPLGPLASFIGTDQLALAPDDKTGFRGSPNYDPTLDPNDPAYQGPQSMLGGIGKTLEQITFGGARPVTETSKGIMSLLEGQDAEKEIKDSVDQTGKNVFEKRTEIADLPFPNKRDDEIKEAFRNKPLNVNIPYNMTFQDFMLVTTPGTKLYEQTMRGDFSNMLDKGETVPNTSLFGGPLMSRVLQK